jgi:hypothetical protein
MVATQSQSLKYQEEKHMSNITFTKGQPVLDQQWIVCQTGTYHPTDLVAVETPKQPKSPSVSFQAWFLHTGAHWTEPLDEPLDDSSSLEP